MVHQCNGCRFHYITDCFDSKVVYNALCDEVRKIFVEIKRDCCGFNPGGAVLDLEQPRCGYYEEKR
ncbi:MAG: hypothetical protein E3J23_08640 [Candidatus Stahlbacteria bacterium]|nr:MAG: hypothetical protein E3J23_08640 [Candidatus Stahlbacteria bacterium]